MVIPCNRRLFLILSAHNDIGHHRVYTTIALLSKRYWWPGMGGDIAWYIETCYICQQQNTQQSFIPPVVMMPAPLFSKVYMDTMHMPSSSGYKYIVQGHCSLIYWPEWAMLAKENAVTLGKWILHDIIYCWGLLLEIITDKITLQKRCDQLSKLTEQVYQARVQDATPISRTANSHIKK